ncbi:Caffeic acid O-methyltransferase [Quillaja saponaria]|uniref:Caffeic acid O-methyltransferase n=1 Tax=Quillaja saponaria TaxID=32244 RepID=A0AAD7L5S7_QUISA|nr:Caffeic acid O-methyltransferase [Quillaja saponaria]
MGFLSLSGVEHVGGDMFETVPRGDAIFMKWILHDWSDEHCLKLLKNCYNAIPEEGKVIVMDAVLPIVPETSNAARSISQMDVLMMTQNPGGKERSREQFMALATEAGFSGIKYDCFVYNFWVMEFFKEMCTKCYAAIVEVREGGRTCTQHFSYVYASTPRTHDLQIIKGTTYRCTKARPHFFFSLSSMFLC